MEEIGRVISKANNIAEILIGEDSSCARCGLKSTCSDAKRKSRIIKAIDPFDTAINSVAKIYLSPSKYILSAFLIFIFPVIILILSYSISKANDIKDEYAIIISIIFSGFIYLLLWILKFLKIYKNYFTPSIIEIISKND